MKDDPVDAELHSPEDVAKRIEEFEQIKNRHFSFDMIKNLYTGKNPKNFGFEVLNFSNSKVDKSNELLDIKTRKREFTGKIVSKPVKLIVIEQENLLSKYLETLGLNEEQARTLLPAAQLVLSDLSDSFRRSARHKEELADVPIELPEIAPELFIATKGRPKKGADIVSFLRRVWKTPWIDAGVLTRADLARLDPAAYQALNNHLKEHDLPQDLQIPTLSEMHIGAVPEQVAAIVERSDPRTLRAIRAMVARQIRLAPNNS